MEHRDSKGYIGLKSREDLGIQVPDHRHLLFLSTCTSALLCLPPQLWRGAGESLHLASYLLVPHRFSNTVAAPDAYIWATDSS